MTAAATAPDRSPLGLDVDALTQGQAEVLRHRERARQRRLTIVFAFVAPLACILWWRALSGESLLPAFSLSTDDLTLLGVFGPTALMVLLVLVYVQMSGKSPHVTYQPEQIDIRLSDVVGIDEIKDDVVRSLNLFLAHKTFADRMGGNPRRGVLFEGVPGTGKTHLAKAMAAEAGVPFLFVSSPAFQSSFYGATARKIRSFFRELRAVAQREGGAIAFFEEFDAIGGRRQGMEMTAAPSLAATAKNAFGTADIAGPVVNELLIQLQSFDQPTGAQRVVGWCVERVNTLLPRERWIRKPTPPKANLLVIAATNRADGLDPALLRPGRFDRRLTFDVPAKASRRALIDYFLQRKAHLAELDDDEARDNLAAVTVGYTPARIERLFDEALVFALQRGATAMNGADVEQARLAAEVGMGQPMAYTAHEKRLIATHEAGHATVAWLLAPERRLEVLTIVKRRDALGMLAHGDRDDVFTRSRSELLRLIAISFGGMVSEELFFGESSTGPSGDLAYATNAAAQMVGAAGMGESLISFAGIDAGPFDPGLVGRVLADPVARATVDSLLAEQKQRVEALLRQHLHLVAALRDALLERHELVGREISDILEAAAGGARPEIAEAARQSCLGFVRTPAAGDLAN